MTTATTGLDALLTPQNSVLMLIDHQPFQFANLHSHKPTMVVNNVISLAKTAKVFGVPTIPTTVLERTRRFPDQGATILADGYHLHRGSYRLRPLETGDDA